MQDTLKNILNYRLYQEGRIGRIYFERYDWSKVKKFQETIDS